MKMVKEIKQYQASDGTCFNTREEAESYEEMLQNPHFKKLQDRIEKLESDLLALKVEVSAKTWKPQVAINRPPYLQPAPMLYNGDDRVPLSHEAYNTATGKPIQEN